jgi:peptide/nickel transport system substrate-binding protein
VKRMVVIGLVVVLAFGLLAVGQTIKNPDTLVVVRYGSPNTLDPAYSYDVASGGVIFNVYENLVRWPAGIVDADEIDLDYSLASADLLPMLATVVPSLDNGLIVTHPDGSVTYQFPIREGVTFHEGGELTPSDVRYSFLRGIFQDRDGGPQWMLIEPLSGQKYQRLYQIVEGVLGIDTERGNKIKDLTAGQQEQVYEVVSQWVRLSSDGKSVVFHLDAPYPPFLSILAHGGAWGAILDKEWVAAQGGWDGAAADWATWYNPGSGQAAEASELYDVMNGTGPYRLEQWDPGVQVVYERFDGYWREPAMLGTVISRAIEEWSNRLLVFQQGDADICMVDPQYLPQVMNQPGIVVRLKLPTIRLNPVAFFTSDLTTDGNDLVGSGKWAQDGIPSEFFDDAHLRKAFAYAFEYDTYIEDVLGIAGGYKTTGPVPKAFAWAYDNDSALYYTFDMEKARSEMKLAHDGKVWDTGFTLTLLYNEGTESWRVGAEILERNIESMNPRFHIEVRGVPWSSYLDRMVTGQMPLFLAGWLADFPDPHNFVVPFAHSTGTFSGWQGDALVDMFKENYDPLISDAMATADQAVRAGIYHKIEQMSFDDCYDLWLPQAYGHRVMRDWVQGAAFNPIFPAVYYYSVYKAYE